MATSPDASAASAGIAPATKQPPPPSSPTIFHEAHDAPEPHNGSTITSAPVGPPPPEIEETRCATLIRNTTTTAKTSPFNLSKKSKKSITYRIAPGSRLENNLSWVVGCLELANAGDFAANVWNELPVPIYATVLMALGGSLAAIMSVFAARDARRAWRNVCFLREQRRQLLCARRGSDVRRRWWHRRGVVHSVPAPAAAVGPPDPGPDPEAIPDSNNTNTNTTTNNSPSSASASASASSPAETRALDVLLAVTFRELGGEVINRLAMDLLLGFGSILISVGTYLAIAGGSSPEIYHASNLLSGWIGNTPIAAFGIINSAWAVYVWRQAQSHVVASRRLLPGSRAAGLVERRSRNVQVFCLINGSATILGGVASMLASIYWWAYVMLIPVIVSSVFCNLWWRRRIGYTRTRAWPDELKTIVPTELALSLEFAARAGIILREKTAKKKNKEEEKEREKDRQQRRQQNATALLRRFVPDSSSLPDVVAFFHLHDLFDDLCVDLTSEPDLRTALCHDNPEPPPELKLRITDVLALPPALHQQALDKAAQCLRRVGRQHFRNRERHMAEFLGTCCTVAGSAGFVAEDESEKQ